MMHSGDKETAKLLLKHGADVEGKIRKNLHVACSQGNLEVVKLLVESGADVEHFDESGSTPLHCAAAGNHPDVVTYLIVDAGCDKNKVRTSIKQIVDIRL